MVHKYFSNNHAYNFVDKSSLNSWSFFNKDKSSFFTRTAQSKSSLSKWSFNKTRGFFDGLFKIFQ